MPFARTLLAVTSISMLTASAAPTVEKYRIDPDDTYIGFAVRHMMVTNVKGKFKSFTGEIDLDEKNLANSSVRINIDAASLSTDNDRRDNHLKSDDFLNVAKYPTISFVSKRVEKTGDKFALVGDLTIRDVTREVVIPFTLTGPIRTAGGRKQLGIEGELTINRFDYNLKYNRLVESVQVVAPDVHIEMSVAANTATP